mgnify:CR=1 FL=1
MNLTASAPQSPVTHRHAATKLFDLDVQRIQDAYNKMGLDVSKYIGQEVSLWQCPATGYRFYYPFNIFGDAAFYENLQRQHAGYYPADKFEHQEALKQVKAGEHLLEVGCGPGHFLQFCGQKGVKAVGLEFNDEAIAACKQKGLEVHKFFIADFAALHPASFDVVCCFQVLEHIDTVKPFLNDCLAALKPGGRLMIAVPNSNPFLYKTDVYHAMNLPPHHAGLWNKLSFEKLPQYFPFTLELLLIDTMKEPKTWFLSQKNWYLEHKPWLGKALSLIPRPLYKMAVRIASPWIDGRNIFVVYRKN